MTLSRELFTIIIEDNRGRSNELNQVNQTSQTQFSCVIEWIISCSKYG